MVTFDQLLKSKMMPTESLAALLAFAGLTMLHVTIELIHRNILIASGKVKPTEFGKMRNSDETTFNGRVANSHANCLENLPLFITVVLVNHALLDKGAPNISNQAWCYVGSRVIQAASHWASVNEAAVTVRFLAFVTSKALLVTMAYRTVMM